jgi:Tol biopolymer transport system component
MAVLGATHVEGTKLDVIVLDAATGSQVGRVTYDGFSWAPVWSPDGDELVYLHLSSTVVEMFMTEVNRSGASFDLQAGLEGDSRPAWYVPGSGSAAETAWPTTPALPQASAS